MLKNPLPSLDEELSPEELAGVGKNDRFDALVNDGEDDSIQVVCRKRNPEHLPGTDSEEFTEVPLAKPSRAFYFGDRNLYLEESTRYDTLEKREILQLDQFPDNIQVFEELKHAIHRGFVIPFVGAGMSRSAGLPDWTNYLMGLATRAGLDSDLVRERLEITEDYENVMSEIIERLTVQVFRRDFERSFQIPEVVGGAICELPSLFDGAVITTNFDRVLEKAYEQESRAFVEKVAGLGDTCTFYKAIPAGNRYLLKLHGNIVGEGSRVLTRREYERAYGLRGDVDMTFPIPKILRRLFSSYSFFFLGCRLTFDRTVTTLMRVAQIESVENLPAHYAVMPRPEDRNRARSLDERLAEANITPLWFPWGEYDYVQKILALLRG